MATLSGVRSLQLTSDDPNSAHLTGVTPEELTTAELSHAHLTRLRQTRKLMAVQLEKTEKEIQRKTSVLSQEREAVEDKRSVYITKSKVDPHRLWCGCNIYL